MNIQIALINMDTGEPIYDQCFIEDEALQAIDNAVLRGHADEMRKALVTYMPKVAVRKSWQTEQPEVAPSAVPSTTKVNFVVEDPNGDLLGGNTDLGY